MIAQTAQSFPVTITDVVMILAVFGGPLVAVLWTEHTRNQKEKRDRKIHVFRTLMSTRASILAPTHVEALNLIDIEFDSKNRDEKKVIESWKYYHSHLFDTSYQPESWKNRQVAFLVELLHSMAECLKYDFDKAHIKNSSYYPKGYGEIEEDQHQIRKKVRGLLEGSSAINVISHMNQSQFEGLTGLQKTKQSEQDG